VNVELGVGIGGGAFGAAAGFFAAGFFLAGFRAAAFLAGFLAIEAPYFLVLRFVAFLAAFFFVAFFAAFFFFAICNSSLVRVRLTTMLPEVRSSVNQICTNLV
jgi:hypothetical protein